MWYTPLGSRPASAECSQTYQKFNKTKKSGRFLSDGSTCILRTTSISNRYKYQLERRSYDLMRKIYTFLFRNELLFNQTFHCQ